MTGFRIFMHLRRGESFHIIITVTTHPTKTLIALHANRVWTSEDVGSPDCRRTATARYRLSPNSLTPTRPCLTQSGPQLRTGTLWRRFEVGNLHHGKSSCSAAAKEAAHWGGDCWSTIPQEVSGRGPAPAGFSFHLPPNVSAFLTVSELPGLAPLPPVSPVTGGLANKLDHGVLDAESGH